VHGQDRNTARKLLNILVGYDTGYESLDVSLSCGSTFLVDNVLQSNPIKATFPTVSKILRREITTDRMREGY
jgi:hypothetical protein